MNIYLKPCESEKRIMYTFKSDVITATYRDNTDVFDFTGLPDGELKLQDENGESLIETSLEINPILSAKRVDGVLYVELLNFIGADATEEECFPEWVTAEQYMQDKSEKESESESDVERDVESEVSADG